jgi:glycosyltransferase involved in cell wall biosynthesis
MAADKRKISVIVPVFNEEENLSDLNSRIISSLAKLGLDFEVIYVDDGSRDRSSQLLKGFAAADPRVKAVFFHRNFGQTAAISAGIHHATGDLVVPMDADLQNDPDDIGAMIEKLDQGFDVVSGWRKGRQDPFFSKVIPSKVANWLTSYLSGVTIHDYGCTLKVYKREFLKDVVLLGEMHRFIPIYASWQGAKITEMPVTHHPRTKGVSKYGLMRVFKVLLDLVTIVFLGRYSGSPMYFFGGVGMLLLLGSILSGVAVILNKFVNGVSMIQTPLLLLTAMLIILGTQFILMGLLAEIGVRTYYEARGKPAYIVKDRVNLKS